MKVRPRFSIRTLVVMLTLACLYFGRWSLTDRFGVPAITSQYDGFRFAYSPVPCVVYVDSNEIIDSRIFVSSSGVRMNSRVLKRHWHFWLFEITPHESTWSESSPAATKSP